MFRVLVSLLGLAVLGAVFAGIYYGNPEVREVGSPAFAPSPGEVRSFGVEPGLEGFPVLVTVTVFSGEVDVYLVDREWAHSLLDPDEARISLDRPFSFHSAWSRTHVNDTFEFTIVSDGETAYTLLIDNSDTYYDDDAVPDPENGTAEVKVSTRYLETEGRTLITGYLAAVPSVLLVVLALGRQIARRRRRLGGGPP